MELYAKSKIILWTDGFFQACRFWLKMFHLEKLNETKQPLFTQKSMLNIDTNIKVNAN